MSTGSSTAASQRKKKMVKNKPLDMTWADYLYNESRPIPFDVVLKGCCNVIERFEQQKEEMLAFLQSSIRTTDKSDTNKIDKCLDLINVTNKWKQRMTAKMLVVIIDAHVKEIIPGASHNKTRNELLREDLKSFEPIQKFRSKEVDDYFNTILEHANRLMITSGMDTICELVQETAGREVELKIEILPNGMRQILIYI